MEWNECRSHKWRDDNDTHRNLWQLIQIVALWSACIPTLVWYYGDTIGFCFSAEQWAELSIMYNDCAYEFIIINIYIVYRVPYWMNETTRRIKRFKNDAFDRLPTLSFMKAVKAAAASSVTYLSLLAIICEVFNQLRRFKLIEQHRLTHTLEWAWAWAPVNNGQTGKWEHLFWFFLTVLLLNDFNWSVCASIDSIKP